MLLVTKTNNVINQCTFWQGLGSHPPVSLAHISNSAHLLAVPQHQKWPAAALWMKLCWNSTGLLVERTYVHLCHRSLYLSYIRTRHRQSEVRDNGRSVTFLIHLTKEMSSRHLLRSDIRLSKWLSDNTKGQREREEVNVTLLGSKELSKYPQHCVLFISQWRKTIP